MIVKTYHLKDRSTVYRHAQALNLYSKRQRNVRAALERIIENAGEVEVTAGAVVAAVQAYAKNNAAGQWIERTETGGVPCENEAFVLDISLKNEIRQSIPGPLCVLFDG